jgi:alkaline phosphatase D
MRRRTFLTGAAAAGAAALSSVGAACVPRPAPVYPPQSGVPFEGCGPFPAGLGSGDPLPDRVLVWTRVLPELAGFADTDVRVEVARHPEFPASSMVAELTARAGPDTDHCVTVDVADLEPATTYWYRFRARGETSPVGRTRTAPDPADHRPVRIAAFSCQRLTHGWFNAHADLAALAEDPATDIDLVVCLGDYVYDTGYADKVYVPGREDPIQRAVTLEEFRSKYRLYRADPDLQAMHARFPVVHVFDNHDGLDGPGDPQAAGALAAFAEHLPVRFPEPGRIHRRLRWGGLVELFLTDQRSYRDPQVPESGVLGTSTEERPEILDPRRSILGLAQRAWLLDGLRSSDAVWKVIGSQLMFWPWRSFPRLPWQPRGAGVYLNMTQWDGYTGERLVVLDHLAAHDVRDTLVLSGDSHVFSCAQVSPDVDDPRSAPRVVEFGTGSVTSNNADESDYPTDDVTGPWLAAVNPHLRFFESERHGYVVVELDGTEARAEFRSPRTILRPDPATDVLARFRVPRGTQTVVGA